MSEFENTTARDVEEMEKKAKNEDRKAKEARDAVNDTLSHMSPQRQHEEDPSQDQR